MKLEGWFVYNRYLGNHGAGVATARRLRRANGRAEAPTARMQGSRAVILLKSFEAVIPAWSAVLHRQVREERLDVHRVARHEVRGPGAQLRGGGGGRGRGRVVSSGCISSGQRECKGSARVAGIPHHAHDNPVTHTVASMWRQSDSLTVVIWVLLCGSYLALQLLQPHPLHGRHLCLPDGRGLHSFPSPLKLSLICSFPLDLSSLCNPWMCPECAHVGL